eukprot:GFYU01002840.1.p1 GENE.GFYU01002840.1~~GFYU01002840.1.p1  ORF type:complete len:224 (+),score=34.31 GFYU01002840.1:26-697(+)
MSRNKRRVDSTTARSKKTARLGPFDDELYEQESQSQPLTLISSHQVRATSSSASFRSGDRRWKHVPNEVAMGSPADDDFEGTKKSRSSLSRGRRAISSRLESPMMSSEEEEEEEEDEEDEEDEATEEAEPEPVPAVKTTPVKTQSPKASPRKVASPQASPRKVASPVVAKSTAPQARVATKASKVARGDEGLKIAGYAINPYDPQVIGYILLGWFTILAVTGC